jgi:hypothetical protein
MAFIAGLFGFGGRGPEETWRAAADESSAAFPRGGPEAKRAS